MISCVTCDSLQLSVNSCETCDFAFENVCLEEYVILILGHFLF